MVQSGATRWIRPRRRTPSHSSSSRGQSPRGVATVPTRPGEATWQSTGTCTPTTRGGWKALGCTGRRHPGPYQPWTSNPGSRPLSLWTFDPCWVIIVLLLSSFFTFLTNWVHAWIVVKNDFSFDCLAWLEKVVRKKESQLPMFGVARRWRRNAAQERFPLFFRSSEVNVSLTTGKKNKERDKREVISREYKRPSRSSVRCVTQNNFSSFFREKNSHFVTLHIIKMAQKLVKGHDIRSQKRSQTNYLDKKSIDLSEDHVIFTGTDWITALTYRNFLQSVSRI